MRVLVSLRLAAAALLLVPIAGFAQSAAKSALPDASWTKTFAGRENQLNGDPRLMTLLKQALPQHQWVWYEHGRFLPVADMAQTFIGVPGDATVDSDRYVTATGCVPHDCTDNGLLWIDTGASSPELIFAANILVSGGPASHLWLFASSTKFDGQKPSSALRVSLAHWLQSTGNSSNHVILITLVKPNGAQVDLTPSTLLSAAPTSGVSQ